MASNVAPYEAVWWVKESAYGTTKTSPVAGTDSIYLRTEGNSTQSLRMEQMVQKIKYGGGYDIAGYAVKEKVRVAGKLQIVLTYTQAALLMKWAVNRINSGQSTPWTTTEPPGDVASATIYHAIMREDGTVKRSKYLGCKVAGGSIRCDADSQKMMLSLDIIGQKKKGNSIDSSSDPDATEFPLPADTAFPTDTILFYHLASGLTINSAALSYPESIGIEWSNMMDPKWFASRFVSINRLRGRSARMTVRPLYTASPDWRTAFEARSSYDAAAVFTNGTNTLTFTMNANNLVDSVNDDLSPGKQYMQEFTLENQYDTSAGADLSITYA